MEEFLLVFSEIFE